MILIYSNPFDKKQIDDQINLLKERLSIFFINDDDFIYSTESNLNLLREIIINHKIKILYTNSIIDLGFSSSELSSFIIYLLKNSCDFQSESDDLYFSIDNIDDVVITVVDLLNQ
jgi:hypothetical protein